MWRMCVEITSVSFITFFRVRHRLCCLAVNTLLSLKPWDYIGADGCLSERRERKRRRLLSTYPISEFNHKSSR